MKSLPLVLLFASLLAPAMRADAPAYPPHTVPGTHLRVLSAQVSDRTYQLQIYVPSSSAKNPGKKYPVVYVTDGYWDFVKLVAAQGGLVFDKVVPEFIVVGLGYAGEDLNYGQLRGWDLSPVKLAWGERTGRAEDFLKLIETEIIPLVEKEYPADPSYRVMSGASLGGLFTLYAMYTKPELFQAYIAVTPAVVVKDDWLLGYEQEFAKAGRQLKGRLFVTVGENESPGFLGGVMRYNARVTSRKYPDLAYGFRIIDGERHSGMQLESYVRGLRFVFLPLAPETGPSASP
jgi:predicted alpha/beta superfamily hydrolase